MSAFENIFYEMLNGLKKFLYLGNYQYVSVRTRSQDPSKMDELGLFFSWVFLGLMLIYGLLFLLLLIMVPY